MNPQSASESDWFSTAEYVNALRNLGTRISDKQRAMLKAHAEAPNRTLSVFELAELVGSDKDNTTYSIYGRLGHMLADELEPNSELENENSVWTRYIGEDFRPTPGAPVCWEMHPELAEALIELGWAHPSHNT
jgi:hypothetical protein